MTFSILLSMFALSLAMSISPGPVNMLVISSGINYGVKKTMPFVSGATIGFTLLLICVAFGFITVLDRFPSVLSIIEIAGYTFIIYMGYKIASSSAELSIDEKEMNTLKFHEGFLLQWLNPKAWIACVSGISMFSSIENSIPFFVIIYFFVCYASLTFW
ncbi:MAG: LysE family translocator, partial [Campylobacterota bacterium]|nr:LysE family translocator [Campylobacterota bacterium]